MRFVTTRGRAPAATLKTAIVEGLAPDGGLYMPEPIEGWDAEELACLSSRSLAELASRVLLPFVRDDLDVRRLAAAVQDALDFPIPLVEIEPEVYALELFHGPTLAFKDVGARVMARMMAALDVDSTVLVATSGDTGSAVAHAFHGVAHTRVVILYPDGRVSPTQEAQLTLFNGEPERNLCAYAIAGSFDDCQRLVKAAFADVDLRRRVRLTSANSINIGRLLPQMIYYFHAVAEASRARSAAARIVISTPSGNFGNLTAGLMAKRAGLPIARFVASTNVNDVVPHYLATGEFEPRPATPTLANAMDVGNPSNFDRMSWMYGGDVNAMRRDVAGSRHDDAEVRATIRRVYDERGYLLDPHSAIGYLGVKGLERRERREGQDGQLGIFLATAHPAKFAEIVEPIVGRTIERPGPLAAALARPRQIVRMPAALEALRGTLMAGGG